jgi:hypothetical protein
MGNIGKIIFIRMRIDDRQNGRNGKRNCGRGRGIQLSASEDIRLGLSGHIKDYRKFENKFNRYLGSLDYQNQRFYVL